MDERHWWIAQRVAQAFSIDPTSGYLEKFICEPSNLEKISNFLCMNGNNKLFFLSTKLETGSFDEIVIYENLLRIPKTNLDNVENTVILFFIRHDSIQEVSPTQIHKEVFCGEIKKISQILHSVYSDLLLTMVESNSNWGNCNETNKTQIFRNLEKYVNSINEVSLDSQSHKNMMLKRVEADALLELKQPRINPDSPIIKYCEDLALEWVSTIENILSDICDERFIHQSVGPNSELERWQRKQRLLSNLTEQLKTKECKSVISALISVKSKILKKWKIIDAGITDAQNECRDKVKFLESLKRPIDQFYHDATPISCVTTALPGLCTAMRTVESVSRYYARQGYLGLLFTKVTNQLVNICKEYLLEAAQSVNNSQYFWPTIFKEIEEYNYLQRILDSNDFTLPNQGKAKSVDSNDSTKFNDNLFHRLKSCLIVQAKYKEAFRNLRDALGGSQALSGFPSISSVQISDQNSGSFREQSVISKKASSNRKLQLESGRAGILMSEEHIIFGHIDVFCERVRCLIEQIMSLSQFQMLFKLSSNLSRPKREDLKMADERGLRYDSDSDDDFTDDDEMEVNETSEVILKGDELIYSSHSKPSLAILIEENEDNNNRKNSVLKKRNEKSDFKTELSLSTSDLGSDDFLPDDDKIDEIRFESQNKSLIKTAETLFKTEKNVEAESKKILKKAQTLSKEDIKLMKKYYNKKNDGPTVSFIIEEYIKLMKNSMTGIKSSQILDVGIKDSNIFQDSYKTFANAQLNLEKFLAAYLNVIFIKTKKTHDGLNVLTTFLPVSQRNILRPIINDKYVEIFSIYQTDLSETEDNFENFKNNPPILRNAPPIGGAISWVRQMLKKIDEPMKIFRENKYINSLSDFTHTLKQYNNLTYAMINFENSYLSVWKTTIDDAKNGLKGYLMKKNDDDYMFEINADEKLLILFQESKWLLRLGIDIPQSARELLAQEKKFKQYKSNLDMLLRNYKEVLRKIPHHLLDLYEPHIRQTLDLCNPGCFILTWNSLNIDSFLKTVENGIKKLENLVLLVRDSKEATVFSLIEKINTLYLFDQKLAFSKKWSPDEFMKELGISIDQSGKQVYECFNLIEEKIEEIGGLLVIPSKGSANLKKKSKMTLKEMLDSEPKLNTLKEFYADKLYTALSNSVLKSLKFLAHACGFESTDQVKNIMEENHDSLKYMRLKSADDLTRKNAQKRPLSVSAVLDETDWSDNHKLDKAFLKLEFVLKFAIPDVITDPSLDLLQTVIKSTASKLVEMSKQIGWIHPATNKLFYDRLIEEESLKNLLNVFDTLLSEIGPSIKNHMIHLRLFEFLWKEDLNGLFNEFIKQNPDEEVIKREVDRLAKIEKQVYDIPDYLNVGPACFNTESIKVSLKTFSYSWKFKYASVLHEMAKTRLHECIIYRENVQKRLMVNVQTLEQLNDALRLLEELSDMENKIDKIYLPIENIYADLQRYDLILTRQEIEQVSSLRENWSQLMKNAEIVRTTLLQDKRNTLEQELDKQVKTFVVEVIRFRNSFDATGPSVTGIDPYEALRRLNEFQKQFDTFDARRKTLDSISILFGLQCKPFPELDKTGEELNLLNQLYRVYQVFLSFDKQFRNTLWSDVDLNKAFTSIKSYWEDFLGLPEKLKENWEAYFDLKKSLKKYIDVLPILILLNEKEIRNRHWLQVMQVTKSAFRLEAAIFKLNDLIDIGLDLHSFEIEEICKSAKKEQELESKMRTIEEEWNEQVLSFTSYKDYGEICFDKEYTERLLEQLEDAQEILANMLTSKYVGPLRNEVASWSEKLKTIAEVLELWLEVQDLWINLESVFSSQVTIKEMPAEAKRFLRVDKSWIRSQKQSYDMKSVLQCCLGSSVQENTKRVLLKDIQKELEICFKSLNTYLEKKRRFFPRYYFLSNPSLLTLLNHSSNYGNITDVKSYFSSIFSSVRDLKLDEIKDKDDIESISSSTFSDKPKSGAVLHSESESPSFYRGTVKETAAQGSDFEISEVYSSDGEVLVLTKKVNLEKGTEAWLPKLKESIGETLKRYLSSSLMDIVNNMPIEELALKYPAQICIIGLNYIWSKEVETSILELKNERKAMSMGSKKFSTITNKFLSLLSKSRWSNIDKPILSHHKFRLEAMITHSNYLRDVFDNIANKKIKDLNDFEWQRCFRVYIQDENAATANPKFCVLDDTYTYGNEFYGIEQHAVITPLTERCFLTILQASRILKGSIVCGKPNSGKTQITKGLAQYLGKFLFMIYCSSQTEHNSIANCLQGVAQEGTWAVFDELQNLTDLCLSWFNEYSSGIYQALRKRSSLVQLSDGKELSVNHNFCLISTFNSQNNETAKIPSQIKSMFRVIALMEPEIEMIIRARCVQYGVKGSNIFATRLKTIYDLCQGSLMSLQSKYQLTLSSFLSVIKIMFEKQNTDSSDSRPGSLAGVQSANKYSAAKLEMLTNQTAPIKELPRKNRVALVSFSKNEHAQIGQMLIDILTPRLDPNDSKVFKKIVQEILMFKEDLKLSNSSQGMNFNLLEKIITEKSMTDYGLFPNKNWIDKCLQIYTVSNIFEGIILCGQPCTGKTSTLQVLVDSLTELGERDINASQTNLFFKQKINSHHSHKIRKINHLAIDDESLLFGSLAQNNEFKDGFLTYALRKACRNQSTTWLCLDGQILPSWCDSFNSIFDSGLFMQLKNGDHLKNNCKLVFETGDITNASPSLLSKAGIICYGEDLVGWRSIARSWLETRTENEVQCLQRCFSKTMDEISNYCLKECKPMLPVCEESLFISCLNLLAAMLNENTNIGGEVHIERLYLYCLIWTFGGVLEQNDQKSFSDLLYRLVTALPDDDLKSSVFEYYVDESGEWDLWSQRVPENVYMDNIDLLGNVYVDTIDSIRCRIFLEFCNLAHTNVILFGPRGCGKSKLLQEFIQEFDSNVTIVKRLNFSGATNVNQLQKFIESNIVHRQGFTFGAPEKKKFSIFIDDINLPVADNYGIQRCNEFIRQVVDSKLIYSFSKPFEVKKLEDISIYSTMTYEPGSTKSIDPRLLRHSILLYLPVPSGQALRSIFNGTLEASILFNEKAGLDADLHACLIDSSVKLLELINDVLRPCPTPGRQHYLFNMKTLITILQNMRKLTDTQRNDNLFVVSLWRYEVFSTIGCQLPRHADCYWLECTVNDLIKEKFTSFTNGQPLVDNFINFRLENRSFDRPVSGYNSRSSKTILSPVDSIEKVRVYLEQVYNRYKEEFGYHQINIFLSENATNHIIRIHRILTFTQSGNLLLIGNIGNHLTSLVKLAFYLADIHQSMVDCSKSSLFYDSMRAAVRTAGSENKYVGLIFSSKDLFRGEYLDTINSLLNNGECNDLFSNDEMDGLYHAIGPSIKREYPNMIIDPKKFFNTRVKRNLHICLTLQPNGETFKLILKNYIQIISSCQIYWIKDWTEEALLNEAKCFMRERLETDDLRERVSKCMSEIHLYMLNESRQIPWTGGVEKDIIVPQTPIVKTTPDKKMPKSSSVSNMSVSSIPNWPYSKNILQELIKLNHSETTEKSKFHFFIGPNTYLKFMNSFWYFFTTKAKQCENDIIRLRKVLETLHKTREGAKQMKAYIKDLKSRCKQAEIDSEESLKILIDKTTAVEKLKAKLGLGGSLATLMQMQKDNDISADTSLVDGKLLNSDEMDEYDIEFNRMRDESEKSKLSKMNEDLDKAKHLVEECKKALFEKKRQVDVWKNRVDKSCIERIRAFQNPPALIGQIMEMIMILIGKKKLPESVFFFKNETSTSQLTNNPPKEKEKKSNSVLENPKLKNQANNKTDRIDRSHWKQFQNLMADSGKFCELLHSVEWEDGLPFDVSSAVESYLAKGKDGQLGLTGEGSLLDNAKDVNIAASRTSDAHNSRGITISGARYASEDAATLVNYVIAILEYTRLCVPLKSAKDKVEAIKHEQAEFERRKMERENENIETNAKPEQNLTEEDLPRLLKELEELQRKFDASAVNKHKLQIELESCIQRMEAATSIIESLTNLEDQWKKWIEEHLSHEQTITNCLITAAFICYCGPFDRDMRNKIGKFFADCCLKHGIPREPQQIFKNFTLPEFLFTPIQLKEIQILRLPETENILENGCFLIEDKSYDSWPLICDSSRRSIDWLKTYYSDKQLYTVREYEMKSVLETCLSEGHYLLLTDCDVETLMNNRKIETVLRNKNRFLNSDKPFKLNLGNQEIECNPKFRLFLHTGSDITQIPDHLAAYTLVLNFKLVRADLEEELLDRFLLLAKPRIDSERYGLLQEKVNTLKIIDPLEQDITNFLASEVDLLNSVEPTKRLSDLKKSYDEAVDSNMRIEIAEEPLTKTRESYREIALRGAICYDVISCLKEINSNYILSFKQFVEIFDESLYQFERSSTPQVISKLTSRVFSTLSRLMNESDRKVFAILLSMEIEAAAGRLKIGEREFIISPLYGAQMIQAVTNKQMTEHKHWQAKKPFDWMTEEQFLNLQYLAVSHGWFNDPFDRMSRDGWETQWRSLCESETPETVPLPDKLDEVLTPIQRFCIVRAVRGDRILQIALSFVSNVLGKNYVSSNMIDFDLIYSESAPNKPVILMFQEESETIRRYFSIYAKSKVGSNFLIIDINSLGSTGDKQIKRTLSKPMEDGTWVLLLNCHNSSKILNQIESILIDSSNKNVDSNFRCWISMFQYDNKPPSSLMLNSIRAFIGPPVTVKENIIRSFSWIDADQVKLSNKPEWPILLHNLCYFHSCLKLRSRYTRCGWNSPYTLNFTTEEFLESLRTAAQEYLQFDQPSRSDSVKSVSDSNKSTSLQSIKFIVADLIYGSSASNEYDLQAIESIAEYWISSIASRKDFELSKLKYKLPNAFTAQPVKISSLQQSLENIPPLQLEAPEACHLLPSIESVLGDDVFIITRLSKLVDCLLNSPTMEKVYDRPLTPIDNSVVPLINSNSSNPLLYTFNTFSTSSYMASQNKKYNDLNEYCTLILTTKLPKVYSKDQINEKVKKSGGWSPYNYWIVNEMNMITNLINTIRNHCQIIKNATEPKKLGWDLNSQILEVADSLYYNQIPKSWSLLSGSATHFMHYPLASFLNDIGVRFQHIEKCLTMGREKNPAFNLGAFYFPQGLLSLFKFETIKTKNQAEDYGCVEPLLFQTEMTSRDKEHLRDPPKEGMFIYGLYLWGCHWEKSTSELVDQPVKLKEGNMPLPVIHLTCWLESEKPLLNDTTKSQDLYKCPVYSNRSERNQSVFEIDLIHVGVPSSKWAMRGVCATLKPY